MTLLLDFGATRQSSLYGGLPPVPRALAERYRQALDIAPPSTYYSVDRFPLAEGLDALVAAYSSSTVTLPSRPGLRASPSMEQMNQLIKCRWILDRMCESSLLVAYPGSVWACAL